MTPEGKLFLFLNFESLVTATVKSHVLVLKSCARVQVFERPELEPDLSAPARAGSPAPATRAHPAHAVH